jgi:hypothetical protein
MQRIDIVLSKAPGSGDIDLSEMVVHWLGPNGLTELTASTFSISPIKRSGTVLEDRPDRMNVSNFGKTIPDGTLATVRFITAPGGTTTVILRAPNSPRSDGAVSLLWKSPSGNPASGSGTATATPTATSTPDSPQSSVQWTYNTYSVIRIPGTVGSSLYVSGDDGNNNCRIEALETGSGSVTDYSGHITGPMNNLHFDGSDRVVYKSDVPDDVYRWDPGTNSTIKLYDHTRAKDVNQVRSYDGDLYLAISETLYGIVERRDPSTGVVWNDSTGGTTRGIPVTTNAVYSLDSTNVVKYDQDGTQM